MLGRENSKYKDKLCLGFLKKGGDLCSGAWQGGGIGDKSQRSQGGQGR